MRGALDRRCCDRQARGGGRAHPTPHAPRPATTNRPHDGAVDTGLCTPAIAARSPALVDGGSLAYLALHRHDQAAPRRWTLGVIGHGPRGRDLADRLGGHIERWNRDRTTGPRITLHPVDATRLSATPDAILKRSTTLIIHCIVNARTGRAGRGTFQ